MKGLTFIFPIDERVNIDIFPIGERVNPHPAELYLYSLLVKGLTFIFPIGERVNIYIPYW